MNQTFYFDALKNKSVFSFSRKLNLLLEEKHAEKKELIILCIGSDRSTGDSLGPLIGHKLEQSFRKKQVILGTLDNPVHAVNLSETLEYIHLHYQNPFIIAIDASLGTSRHVGYVTLSEQPLRPGLGVKKNLPEVGDICITGIVNVSGSFGNALLQSTRLATVMSLADYISNGIFISLYAQSSSSMTCISR